MTVDRLVEREAREAPCRTHEIPLGQAIAVETLPRVEGVAAEAYAALAAVTATPPTRCWRWRASAESWPSRSLPAPPTCSQRSRWRPAASRRAHRRCAAPAYPPGPLGGARADTEDERPACAASATCSRASSTGMSRALERGARGIRRGGPRGGDRGAAGGRRRRGRQRPPAARCERARATLRARGRAPRARRSALLMGIVNASPDSFSDGGTPRTLEARVALARAAAGRRRRHPRRRRRVGLHRRARRSRPTGDRARRAARARSPATRCTRVGRHLQAARWRAPRSPRERAIVNDVSGLRDPDLAAVCAETGAALVLMQRAPRRANDCRTRTSTRT